MFLEYIGVFCIKVKRISGPTRADMFTQPSLRKKVKDASVVSAGHVLVLVFAAKCRHLALRAAWVGERASRHVFFSREIRFVKAREIRFVKASYTL